MNFVRQGWEADQLGWAAFALAVGTEGITLLDDHGDRFGDVAVCSDAGVAGLVAAIGSVDRAELEARFDAEAFGERFGAMPGEDEREWVVEAAEALIAVVPDAAEPGQDLVWVIF